MLRLQHGTVDMCRANWNDFKKGLSDVEALEQELIAAKFVCAKGRESLERARLQLEESNVAAQFRKKQVLQEVCVVMSQLKEAVNREDRAREALTACHPDYALARSLCEESREHLVNVAWLEGAQGCRGADVHIASDVLGRLGVLEQRLELKVIDGLKEVCKDLDRRPSQSFSRRISKLSNFLSLDKSSASIC